MNVSLSASLGPLTSTTPPAVKSEKAAREFESVLLTSLFDSLQKSFAFDPQDETPGASDYRTMGTQALAKAVSNGGGIGIGRLILRHLRTPGGPAEAEREGVQKG